MSKTAARSQSVNTNFVRPGDPQRTLQGRNFVSRESADLRAAEVESTSGVAIRRTDESDSAFKKRSKAINDSRERTRSVMAPQIARRELDQLEKKWAGKVPSVDDAEYMNDCRYALGWPEIDYRQPIERQVSSDAQARFVAFKRKPERQRISACSTSDDLEVMRVAAIHDSSEDVRRAAEDRLQHLYAKRAAS